MEITWNELKENIGGWGCSNSRVQGRRAGKGEGVKHKSGLGWSYVLIILGKYLMVG